VPKIRTSIVFGSGVLPKNVGVGSTILFDASDFSGDLFWELISKPQDSDVTLTNLKGAIARLVNLSYGSYVVRLHIDIGTENYKSSIATVSVPKARGALPIPSEPSYGVGGRVRNFNFELPGILPGYAAMWDIIDDADVLDSNAGVSRGRIEPVNFSPVDGKHAFCLGDDLGVPADFLSSQIFSASQDVDFTNVNHLRLNLKRG